MNTYPEDAQLQRIREWDYRELWGWFAYIKSVGNYWPDETFGWKRDGNEFHISTGGWSGNEDIITAMQKNTMCWLLTWQSSRRGGHYVFEIPKEVER